MHLLNFSLRVIDRMQHEMPENRVQNKWPELVDNLWTKYLTHIREVIFSMTTLEFLQTTDVVVYGFPLQDEKVDTGTEMRKDFEKEIEKPSTINKIFENVQDYSKSVVFFCTKIYMKGCLNIIWRN